MRVEATVNMTPDELDDGYLVHHPFVHVGLGESLYLVLAKYPRGFQDLPAVTEALKREGYIDRGRVTLVSGQYDMAALIWLAPTQVDDFIDLFRSTGHTTKFKCLSLRQVDTPAQRRADRSDSTPFSFDEYFTEKNGRWVPPDDHQCYVRKPNSDQLTFLTLLNTAPQHTAAVFSSLRDSIRAITQEDEEYLLATYGNEGEHGCVLLMSLDKWPRYMQTLADFLREQPSSISPETFQCVESVIWGDEIWPYSNHIDSVRTREAIETRAVSCATGVYRYVDSEIGRLILEELTHARVRRSLLTYDHMYYWDFIETVQSLIKQVALGQEELFIAQMLSSLIRMEHSLCNGIRQLFVPPDQPIDQVGGKSDIDRRILVHLGLVGYGDAEQAMRALRKMIKGLNLTKREMQTAQSLISEGTLAAQFAANSTFLSIRFIAPVIKKIREKYSSKLKAVGGAPDYIAIEEHPVFQCGGQLDADWAKEFDALASYRNEFAHGNVGSIFASGHHDQAIWRDVLRSFIVVYPQAMVIERELARFYEDSVAKFERRRRERHLKAQHDETPFREVPQRSLLPLPKKIAHRLEPPATIR